MVLQDLLAVGALDLVLSGFIPELRKTKNLVMILALEVDDRLAMWMAKRKLVMGICTNLPVLRLTLEHHRILLLAYVADFIFLNLLGLLLGLDAVILGECALVPRTTSMGEEVGAGRLD